MTEQDALAEACRVGLYLTEYDDPNPEEAARQLLAALPPDAHLFTVESLIDALAGTNINERDQKRYRDIFRTQAEDAIRYAIQAAKEASE